MLKFQKAKLSSVNIKLVHFIILCCDQLYVTGLSKSYTQATVTAITYNTSKEELWHFIFSLVLALPLNSESRY